MEGSVTGVSVRGKLRRVVAFMHQLNAEHKPGDPIGVAITRITSRDKTMRYWHLGEIHRIVIVDEPVTNALHSAKTEG